MCSTTTTCCLNLSSGSAPFSSIPKASRIPRKVDDSPRSRGWSGQSVIVAGLAYAAIGIGVSSLFSSDSIAAVVEDDVLLEVAGRRQRGAMRWSEKRACPPWRSKEFEQVVPENLPRGRASPRHKLDSIGHPWDAPGVAGIQTREKGINADCFSL